MTLRHMSTDHDRQAKGKRIMAEIVAIPAILAFPPEVYPQLFSKSYQDPVGFDRPGFGVFGGVRVAFDTGIGG